MTKVSRKLPSTPKVLSKLPNNWKIVRGGSLRGVYRWLIVGPAGGVLISTLPYRFGIKMKAESLTYRGIRTNDAEEARAAGWLSSAWLTDLAENYVPVQPVMVCRRGTKVVTIQPPVGYFAVSSGRFNRWLVDLPYAMSVHDAEVLTRIACDSD